MSNVRKLREKAQIPKALVCGALKDEGRVLFLKRKDRQGIERLEMPCALNYGEDPMLQLVDIFKQQTGIDAEVEEIIFEGRYNAGSRKRKKWIKCLVFRIKAKRKYVKIGEGFVGYKWMILETVKKEKLDRKLEWIRTYR